MGYDAGKRTKGRKRFFLVDTLGNLLSGCVVAAHCHDGGTATRLWDALTLNNELLDRLQTVFVDGGFSRRFHWHLAQHGLQAQVPRDVVAGPRFLSTSSAWWSSAVLLGPVTTAAWPKTTNAAPSTPQPGSTWLTFGDSPS